MKFHKHTVFEVLLFHTMLKINQSFILRTDYELVMKIPEN